METVTQAKQTLEAFSIDLFLVKNSFFFVNNDILGDYQCSNQTHLLMNESDLKSGEFHAWNPLVAIFYDLLTLT